MLDLDDLDHPKSAGFAANSLAVGDSRRPPVAGNADGSFSFRDPKTLEVVGDSIQGVTATSRASRTPVDRDGWQKAACAAAGRNLTKAEWKAHIGGTPRATCPQYPPPR